MARRLRKLRNPYLRDDRTAADDNGAKGQEQRAKWQAKKTGADYVHADRLPFTFSPLAPYTYVARDIGFVDLAQPRQPYAALLANPRATAGDRHNARDQTA